MTGEVRSAWADTWERIWAPLAGADEVPVDIFCELYREINPYLASSSDERAVAALLEDDNQLRECFRKAQVLAGLEADDTQRPTLEVTDLPTAAGGRLTALQARLCELTGDENRAAEACQRALDYLVAVRRQEHARDLETALNDPVAGRSMFHDITPSDFLNEKAAVEFLEGSHRVLKEVGGRRLADRYFVLLGAFMRDFNLRYDLARPCVLYPSLPGMFGSLVADMGELAGQDAEVSELLVDFQEAFRDLRIGATPGRIKTCLQKEVMLLEGLASMSTSVKGKTLGEMCDEVSEWPHPAVPESLKKLYGFASDRSGIRHGKSSKRSRRPLPSIQMRDLVALSVLLAGFAPYLCSGLDSTAVYARD